MPTVSKPIAPLFADADPLGLKVITPQSADKIYNQNLINYAVEKSTQKINSLDEETKQMAIKLWRGCYAAGLLVEIFSAYRGFNKQAELYKDFSEGKRSIPTAPPGKSFHNFGRAIDAMVLKQDGSGPFLYGPVGMNLVNEQHNIGFTWGGDFKDPDPNHFANTSIPIEDLQEQDEAYKMWYADLPEGQKIQMDQGNQILEQAYNQNKGKLKAWFKKNTVWITPTLLALTASIIALLVIRVRE